MKKIIAILVLTALVFVGCGKTAADADDGEKKPTSCALSDEATENGDEGGKESASNADDAINLDAKNGNEALENGMKSVKAVNQEGISRYFGADFWQWHFDIGDEELALIKRALPQMEYEFVKFEESESGGVFGTVRIKAIDLGMEFLDVQQRLEDWYQAMALADLEVTYEGKRNELFRIYNSELDDTQTLRYKETEVCIEAYCDSTGKWSLSRSDEFLWALFGTVTWGMGMG